MPAPPASTAAEEEAKTGPWNPGISSRLPRAFLPLSTMFRPESVFTSVEAAHELSDFTGMPAEDLVAFRPERLVMHELLIRVTADLSVSDGPRVEDLGINFRDMAAAILARHIAPHMDGIVASYAELRRAATALIAEALASTLFAAPMAAGPPARRGRVMRFLRPRSREAPSRAGIEERERLILADWRREAEVADDPLAAAAYRSLARLGDAVSGKHGRLVGDCALLTALAADMVCNEYGSETIGRLIEPHIREGAAREGYGLLPSQERPVVMNVKGASAAGKSTMRPLQRRLAAELGIEWADFALISPDIWRKYLLDYDSLGEARKYAGTLTGHEVEVIDRKLDRYMAAKAEDGRMSHLLIDRFRFDSFTPESGAEEGSNLLTRFGEIVYMFFMITPPHATVERGWRRGERNGRYKAVDDLLDHNVEAYTGMPRLFFTWALRADKRVHYEFLDNDVPEGARPRTVAFGWGGDMNVLDIKCLLDVDRYRKIDIGAIRPEDVYGDTRAMAPGNNTEFLRQCARMLRAINFADYETGRIYARMEAGRFTWTDPQALAAATRDPDTRAGLEAFAAVPPAAADEPRAPRVLDRDNAQTAARTVFSG